MSLNIVQVVARPFAFQNKKEAFLHTHTCRGPFRAKTREIQKASVRSACQVSRPLPPVKLLEALERPLRIQQHADGRPVAVRLFGRVLRVRAGRLRGLHVGVLRGGFELADGGGVAERRADVRRLLRVAVAAVEGADAGNADGEDGDSRLDGGPDGHVDDVVWWLGLEMLR